MARGLPVDPTSVDRLSPDRTRRDHCRAERQRGSIEETRVSIVVGDADAGERRARGADAQHVVTASIDPNFLGRVSPELRALVPALPVLDLSDVAGARSVRQRAVQAVTSRHRPDPDVIRESRRTVAGRVDVYRPRRALKALPALLWVHGGGHVLGFLGQDTPTIERIVQSVGCVVVAVDWRRAPEHPFPAELDDCYTALMWTVEHAAELGIDIDRVAVGGYSSGAGTAAGLALLARDRGEIAVCFQLLLYPMLDDRNDTATSPAADVAQVWNRRSNALAWQYYLGAAAGAAEVPGYAAPARATDLSGLPPAYLPIGDLDLFFDEALAYAGRLARAGVSVELHVYPGGWHGFDNVAAGSELAERFARDRDDALRRALHGVGAD